MHAQNLRFALRLGPRTAGYFVGGEYDAAAEEQRSLIAGRAVGGMG